jgi:hypothetical protein
MVHGGVKRQCGRRSGGRRTHVAEQERGHDGRLEWRAGVGETHEDEKARGGALLRPDFAELRQRRRSSKNRGSRGEQPEEEEE